MEGTRNERVVVLVVSYLIGFITAYIAFGLTQLEEKFVYVEVDNTASAVNALKAVEDKRATEESSENTGVAAITKEGLVLVRNDKARLLSATQASADGVLPDGFHTRIADYSLSPDGKYVYFCEVPGEDIDVCRPYLYSVEKDEVFPIKLSGERVAFEADGKEAYWDEDGAIVFE